MSKANQEYHESDYEIEDGIYCTIYAQAYYHYTPGTMYRSNGDPGDPPEEDFEVLKVELTDFYGIDEEDRRYEFVPSEERIALYTKQVQEMLDDGDQNGDWEDIIPEPPKKED